MTIIQVEAQYVNGQVAALLGVSLAKKWKKNCVALDEDIAPGDVVYLVAAHWRSRSTGQSSYTVLSAHKRLEKAKTCLHEHWQAAAREAGFLLEGLLIEEFILED